MRAAYVPSYHAVSAYVRGGPGSEVAKQYNVRGFPVILFVDGRGEELCRSNGGFLDGEDGVDLHRYVQKIARDPAARKAQGTRRVCERVMK